MSLRYFLGRMLPDKIYLSIKYHERMGRRCNFRNPETYTEKLQWIKLYDRNPLYTSLVDKYAVKNYVSERIGEEYIIPTIGVWNSFEEIDFDTFPSQFVLKCTHDSGGLVICKDKNSFDKTSAKDKIDRCMKKNFYYQGREWPYKDVVPRIIGEQYMEDYSTKELRDYKFFCFDGKVKALFVATDRQNKNEETTFDFYTPEFIHLDIINGHPNSNKKIDPPASLNKMIDLAETLSAGIPHVRVDFYDVNGKPFFGEMTFFHWSGLMPFEPEKWDYTFGSWLRLPNSKVKL